eukprot:TRINITY_DN11978_c0_g1_i1.p1 TRINITY_DN11978_c0_g1~~TRINITY_DN11978_c0_g1_i1.p1  ORF type:complete len:981 (+),score=403.29 TRINITY_DN11978_c0_g1_i1:92-3034(+)
MSSGSNIKVYVRVRPALPGEIDPEKDTFNILELNTGSEASIRINRDGEAKRFFRRVWGPDAQQEEVWREVGAPSVASIFEGFDATIFVYGQTGSGKTYTLGCTTPGLEGLQPRAIDDVFRRLEYERKSHEGEVEAKYLQLYRENALDLLDVSHSRVNIRIDDKAGVVIEGCTSVTARNAQELHALVAKGDHNRVTANTKLNSSSSRSHACLILTVTRRPHGTPKGGPGEQSARLNLIDLAGSERVHKSGCRGDTYKEAISINKSLAVLGKCIHGIVQGERHVAFRDSKLTRILQPCLTGRGRSAIIVTVQPSSADASETASTLKFGERALRVQAEMTTGDYRDLMNGALARTAAAQDREGDALAELQALQRASEEARARLAELQQQEQRARERNAQAVAEVRAEVAAERQAVRSRQSEVLEQQRLAYQQQLAKLREENADKLAAADARRQAERADLDARMAKLREEQESRLQVARARTAEARSQPEPPMLDEEALRQQLEEARRRVREMKQKVRDCTPSANSHLSAAQLRKKAAHLRAQKVALGAKARDLQALKAEQEAQAEMARRRALEAPSDRTVTASVTEQGGSGKTSSVAPTAPSTPIGRAAQSARGSGSSSSLSSLTSHTTESKSSSSSDSGEESSESGSGRSKGSGSSPKGPPPDPRELERQEEEELFSRVEVRQFRNASRRETHLHNLVEQILVYLQHGSVMTRVVHPDGEAVQVQRTWVWLISGRTVLCCCSVDKDGMFDKDDVTCMIKLKDVKDVVLGQYHGAFQEVERPAGWAPDGGEAARRRVAETGKVADTISVSTLHDHYYRSMGLSHREGFLDLIADTDTDFEAWTVALHKLTTRAEEGGSTVAIDPTWGEPIEISQSPRVGELSDPEKEFCRANHIVPERYLEAKQVLLEPAEPRLYLTLYDVRRLSDCDLLHSQKLFEFFQQQQWIVKQQVHVLTHWLRDAAVPNTAQLSVASRKGGPKEPILR